jgi:hypothetical protein
MADAPEASLDEPQKIIDAATLRANAIVTAKQQIEELLDLYALNPQKRPQVIKLADELVSDLVNIAYDAAEGKLLGE